MRQKVLLNFFCQLEGRDEFCPVPEAVDHTVGVAGNQA
jgi:hypothetical protein